MASTRLSETRKMNAETLNESSLLTPFLYIHPQFGYSAYSIYRKIESQATLHLGTYPNTFPNTIEEYFWIYTNAEKTLWKALGTMGLNGITVYFFYTAAISIGESFEHGHGHMNLWVSAQYSDIIQHVMDTETYERYVSETTSVL